MSQRLSRLSAAVCGEGKEGSATARDEGRTRPSARGPGGVTLMWSWGPRWVWQGLHRGDAAVGGAGSCRAALGQGGHTRRAALDRDGMAGEEDAETRCRRVRARALGETPLTWRDPIFVRASGQTADADSPVTWVCSIAPGWGTCSLSFLLSRI